MVLESGDEDIRGWSLIVLGRDWRTVSEVRVYDVYNTPSSRSHRFGGVPSGPLQYATETMQHHASTPVIILDNGGSTIKTGVVRDGSFLCGSARFVSKLIHMSEQ